MPEKISDRIARVAETGKNITFIVGALLAGTYLLWPGYRIWVREHIYREDAWFYLGWWNLERKEFCSNGAKDCTRNFYFMTGYDQSDGSFPRGTVLMNTNLAQGLTRPGYVYTQSSARGGPAIAAKSVLPPYKCIFILETKQVPILEDQGKQPKIDRKGIWARAIPDACQPPRLG